MCFIMYSYCMVREAKKPSFVRLDRRSNEELKTQTKYLCDVSIQIRILYACMYVHAQCSYTVRESTYIVIKTHVSVSVVNLLFKES